MLRWIKLTFTGGINYSPDFFNDPAGGIRTAE